MQESKKANCGTALLSAKDTALALVSTQQLKQIFGQLTSALSGIRAYKVHYQYGSHVIGRKDKHNFSKFLPPCFEKDNNCQICKELAAQTAEHRPLLILLDGAAEEYFALPAVSDAGIRSERAVPYNVHWPGDMPGLIEAVNALTISDYGNPPKMVFDNPIRRLVAGARSIFLTVPLEDERVLTLVKKVVDREIREKFYPGSNRWTSKRLGREFQRDHSQFLQMICNADALSWKASLLVVPIEQLKPVFQIDNSQAQLALALLKEAWIRSRGTRSDHIRQAALYAALQPAGERDFYSDMTIHHLFSVGRGDLPGFAPLRPGAEAGPFSSIQNFMKVKGFQRAGMKWFPSILQPAHLGKNGTNSVYYSFQYPTLFAPVFEYRNRAPLAKVVKPGLEMAHAESPDLAPGVEFEFFQAEGRPNIPGIAGFKTKKQLAPAIKSDFQHEIRKAEQLWNLKDDADFLPGGKKGFMSRFVRISTSS
jgi:hypothetical protein